MLLEDHLGLQNPEPIPVIIINITKASLKLTDIAIKIAGTVQKSEYQVPQKMQMAVNTMDRVK